MSGATADVLVVGAGLAGLAASVALSAAGARVCLLERKPYVGGRAYSYMHPALAEEIDSQHVLLGCCTNLIDLCEQAGAAHLLRWYDSIPLLEPATETRAARRSQVGPGGLPAPPNAVFEFLRAPMLGMKEKLAVVRGLADFVRGYPASDAEAFSTWLERTRQPELAVQHFWEPIALAALNDSVQRVPTRYMGMVLHEMLLLNQTGGRFGIPTLPLSSFYALFSKLAETQGAEVRVRAGVERLGPGPGPEGWTAVLGDGSQVKAKQVLLALPFEQTAKLLETAPQSAGVQRLQADLPHFTHAPITTIHLWFDRDVCEEDIAGLLDTRIQWLFNKTRIRATDPVAASRSGQYLELTISGSFPELKMSREEILQPALVELARFFPRVREAKLVKSGVLKEARATFSVTPGLDRYRPENKLGEGLYVAGDWTRTGWPSTMEGAVRSGRMAAEAVLRDKGSSAQVLSPDLPAQGLMRWLAATR